MAKRREDAWTIRRLREVWDYDPATGQFTRKEKQRGGSKPSVRGDAGGITTNGYRVMSLDAVHYLAHRLAWAYVKDEWPSMAIEHINGNRLDNRIANLREKWGGHAELSQDRLKQVLDYEPETGVFRWKIRTPRSNIGDIAGCDMGIGYWLMSVDGKRYLAHRLAWLWTHGRWPTKHIDHINGQKSDNRIANLRDVTVSQNSHSTLKTRPSNKCGYPGVSQKNNKFLSRIMVNNRVIQLGSYNTIAEARIARLLGEKKYLGKFMSYDDKRDGILPMYNAWIVTMVVNGELCLLNENRVPTPLYDIKELQIFPVTETGDPLH